MAETNDPSTTARQLLRYSVAVVAYRGGKALRGVPDGFAEFRAGDTTREPIRILAHVNDLYDWALWLAKGEWKWSDSVPGTWDAEVARFHAGLAAFDAFLEGNQPLGHPVEAFMAGPIADSLTHIGQLNMLRRLADSPVKGERYAKAEIVAGRVGPVQTAPKREFD